MTGCRVGFVRKQIPVRAMTEPKNRKQHRDGADIGRGLLIGGKLRQEFLEGAHGHFQVGTGNQREQERDCVLCLTKSKEWQRPCRGANCSGNRCFYWVLALYECL